MFCSKCGSQNKDNSQQCESCGQPLPSNQPTQPLVQKRKMPFWFKIVAALAVLALIFVTIGILFTESIVEVVDEQLATLRAKDITKAYYAYTSKDFQAATSLEQFKQYINSYPAFENIQATHFSERAIKDNVSTIKGTLTTADNEKIPIEYQLIKEDGKWKILNIQLVKNFTDSEKAASEAVISVINAQLAALKNHDIPSAYEKFSSIEFKQVTNLDLFKAIIDKYPFLIQHQNVDYSLMEIHPDSAELRVNFQTDQGTSSANYNMVKQNGSWKVWSINVLEKDKK